MCVVVSSEQPQRRGQQRAVPGDLVRRTQVPPVPNRAVQFPYRAVSVAFGQEHPPPALVFAPAERRRIVGIADLAELFG